MATYAIGDIHGHLDKLQALHSYIVEDRQAQGDSEAPVIHIGDLVDRGPDSRGGIDFLIAGAARGESWVVLGCVVLAGASLGFLVWNWPPARIFMGDVGSIPLGFLCVLLGSLLGREKRAEDMWEELYVRQNTGIHAEGATAH